MMLVTRQVYLSHGSPISYLHTSIFDNSEDIFELNFGIFACYDYLFNIFNQSDDACHQIGIPAKGSPISYLHISIFDDNKEDNMLVRCRYFYLENRLENQYNTVELAIISKSLEPLGAEPSVKLTAKILHF